MYKTVNGMFPNYLSKKFSPISTVREHNLRGSSHKLFVPRPLTGSLKKSISFRGVTLWNDIPVELARTQSVAEFNSKNCQYLYILLHLHAIVVQICKFLIFVCN